MIWMILTVALAGPERYPLQAEVQLPAEGISSVHVPAGLRSALDPVDGSDLLLVDADGAAVPFAVVRGGEQPERVTGTRGSPLSNEPLSWWPNVDGSWTVMVRDRPVDALDIQLPGTPAAATARVTAPDGTVVEQVIWNVQGVSSSTVPVPSITGAFKLELQYRVAAPPGEPAIDGQRLTHPRVPMESFALPVTASRLNELGQVRYDVELPAPWPVQSVRLDPAEELFERQASARAPERWHQPDQLPPQDYGYDNTVIRRLNLGGAVVDDTTLRVTGTVQDRLAIFVDAREAPLTLTEVTVGFPGEDLLVQDPGRGPFTLYAGAPPGTTPPSQLQFAAAELSRLATHRAEPGDPAANPAYVPPEVRGSLVEPGPALDLSDYRWRHAIDGTGLVRVRLDQVVLSTARPDLADLRLVDREGRQIPYLLRSDGDQQDWGELPFTRRERGPQSVLEVTLPTSNVLVGTVTLHTGAPMFSRLVTVARPRAGQLETLRAFQWMGADRPTRLTLDVHQRLGDTLVITIENGDNAPLPVDRVEATWPSWSVVAVLPEGGVDLVYGHPTASHPSYDLGLLYEPLTSRVDAEAALGPQEPLQRAPLSMVDQAMVFFGVGVMGLGLLGLTLILLRRVPDPDPPGPEASPPGGDGVPAAAGGEGVAAS